MANNKKTIADIGAKAMLAREEQVSTLCDQIDEVMEDAVELSDDARGHALRLRGGEAEALDGVLQFAKKHPELFKGLADKDEGKDPGVFETDLVRERLQTAVALQRMLDRIDETRQAIADSLLYVSTLGKGPALAAYEIAKVHAQHDPADGKLVNPAVNLYSGIAKAGAQTRKNRKNGK